MFNSGPAKIQFYFFATSRVNSWHPCWINSL